MVTRCGIGLQSLYMHMCTKIQPDTPCSKVANSAKPQQQAGWYAVTHCVLQPVQLLNRAAVLHATQHCIGHSRQHMPQVNVTMCSIVFQLWVLGRGNLS